MASYTVGIEYPTLEDTIEACSTYTQDTVLLPSGTYNLTSRLNIYKASEGGWCTPILLKAVDPDNRPVLNFSGVANNGIYISTIRAAAVGTPTFEDIIFEDAHGPGTALFFSSASPIRIDRCLIRNCTLEVVRYLIGTASRQAYVRNTKFQNVGLAIRSGGTAGLCDVQNCEYYGNDGGEFVIGGTADVSNCSVSFSDSTGSNKAVVARNATNVSVQNRGSVAWKAIEVSGTYKNCLSYGTITTPFSGTDGGGNITGSDPLYTSPSTMDFTPQSGSPLIDNGFTDVSITEDINGTSRPQGSAYDIGSVEVDSSTTYSSVVPVDIGTVVLNLTDTVAHDATAEDEGNFSITETTGSPVAIANATTDGNPMSYITLITSVHTNGATYNLAWSGITGLADGNANYVAVASMPEILSATMTGRRVVRVVFTRPMLDDSELIDVSNYVLTPSSEVSSVVRVGAATVDVTFVDELKSATPSIAISGPTDLASNAVNDSASFSNTWIWVSSITRTADNRIRVSLSNGTVNPINSSLLDESNYLIGRVAPITGVGLTVASLTVDPGGTYIDLTLDREQTTGQVYSLTINNVDLIQ